MLRLSRILGLVRGPFHQISPVISPSCFSTASRTLLSDRTKQVTEDYSKHVASNYTALDDLVLMRGEGVVAWDVDGRPYYDFMAAFGTLCQGHRHPKIVAALGEQADTLTITGRNFYNDVLGEYAKYATELFGYDKLLPMNSGVEAAEASVKLARRWGYEVSVNTTVLNDTCYGDTYLLDS